VDVRQKILSVIRSGSAVSLANSLMRIPDREIALCLLPLRDGERARFFALLGPAKARRVKEEIDFQKTLHIPRKNYLKVVDKFLSYFGPGKKDYRDPSYVRPRKRR
jgi:hypothetical protein